MKPWCWMAMSVLAGCFQVADSDTESPTDTDTDPALECTVSAAVHSFQTSDDVTLEADFYSTGVAQSPVAILLHMIPPHHDRTGYPSEFIESLRAKGLAVLNVDRRGAGASGGVAEEAYQGPNGALDVAAAVGFLESQPCGPDVSRLVIVGASNGTTSALDHTIQTAGAQPKALVFLTGGHYTENQHKIAENRTLLDAKPILFVFSTEERAWSAGFMGAEAPSSWQFDEYSVGDHGTKLFGVAPESVERVAEWMGSTVGS